MEPNWGWDLLRNILSFLDSAGYALVSGVYNVFFTVANAQIFSGDIIDTFFSRIQLILATFMIFSLAITALNIIINPDAFKDKQKGAGKIVTRVALSLVMLTLVVPFDIPNDNNNPLNEQISSNGILFGFLYQFQNSVMQDNILGKLILGSNADSNEGNFGDLDNMSDIGGTLATTVAKAFITPTLNDDSDAPDVNPDGITEDDVACPEAITDYDYSDSNLSYKTLVKYINVTCDSEEQGEVYIFDYTPLLGLVCSIIMAIIIIGFTLDVAVRAIKLVLLRLIAPIPIISYIIPGQEKNGAFNNWLKTLASTYMDLFLRIIIIYFGAYVILVISEGGVNIWQNSPGFYTSLFASVFIIIGVLVFMKQAPKFFQDMLGLKGDGKLFSGIGTMLGAAALTGGIAGSIATNAMTSFGENREKGRGVFKSALGAVGSGFAGGLGGAFVGGKALMSTDKNKAAAVRTAQMKRNTMRRAGSTWWGRAKDVAVSTFTGSSPADKLDDKIQAYNDFASQYDAVTVQADADGKWIDGMSGMSVKDLKENLDRLKVSNASSQAIKSAETLYKNAQRKWIDDVMTGNYKNNRGVGGKDTNFSTQAKQDIDAAMAIKKNYGLDLVNINNADDFKIAAKTAPNKARNIKNSRGYKARKVNKTQ